MRRSVARLLVALLCSAAAGLSSADYGLGATPDPERLAAWDIDVSPSGAGLPDGQGSVRAGKALYAQHCAACHGANGEGGVNEALAHDPADIGYSHDPDVPKAVGNYWLFATTLFDYIRRAMPFTAPGSLSNEEVYALTAYILHLNNLVAEDAVLDASSLPQVQMPARERLSVAER